MSTEVALALIAAVVSIAGQVLILWRQVVAEGMLNHNTEITEVAVNHTQELRDEITRLKGIIARQDS